MMTISELYKKISDYLEEKKIETYTLDARLLMEHFLGISTSKLYVEGTKCISENDIDKIWPYVTKRGAHYPLQYILGVQEFMGYEFEVNENVLIPRPETELLVERVCEIYTLLSKNGKDKLSVLDMCTGSGAIAISLGKICDFGEVVAVDISDKALEVAKKNAKNNDTDVTFIKSDLFENISNKFDIIVSNPPYIKTDEINHLMEDVKNYEPRLALDGLEDGLYFYREIIKKSRDFLNHGAYICFEIGYDQADSVKKLLEQESFYEIVVYKDYAKLDRIVIAKYL